ncbi:hypothetical protein [Prevotella sp. KH2C16]|uniref:hypothetical protein n=1 Tax=Prevotella sp. KH2C16 TaxID=1855325 RepID=UPI0008EBB3DF|nr:hypothetical protein [Prevotella sp. KH2C16]SFF83167.1 hypothetical protein SAMN05216383_101121 [Prevotella sp. KH2C16]
MKKKYIKPVVETVQTEVENLLAGHSYDHADAKPGLLLEEEENSEEEDIPQPVGVWK